MWRFLSLLIVAGVINSVSAQEFNSSDLDSAARSARGNSVLFGNRPMPDEEEIRQRQAYEEQLRQQEEAARRAEEERRRALRPVNLFGKGLKIFAEVNGDVITTRDMQNRVNSFVATTQIPINATTKQMVIDKVLQATIDEKIKLQEADKQGIKISDADLDKGVQNFAKSNGVSIAQLRQMFREAQVDESVFRSQMKAEMAWSRLLQRKAAQDVVISQSEIKSAMDTISKDIQTEKFMVSEIVIPKKNAANIQHLVDNLRQDPRFELYAVQFSESPSSRNGGKLGWVNKGQLAEPLEQALQKMKAGAVSNPIALGSDYYILKLEKKYVPGVDKAPVPTEDEVREMLGNKKMEEIAIKYLRDLRNKAIVDIKA